MKNDSEISKCSICNTMIYNRSAVEQVAAGKHSNSLHGSSKTDNNINGSNNTDNVISKFITTKLKIMISITLILLKSMIVIVIVIVIAIHHSCIPGPKKTRK